MDTFRKSAIKKASSEIFRGGAEEKHKISQVAGSAGFSRMRMEKELRERGYDPLKRKMIMKKILGKSDSQPDRGLTLHEKTLLKKAEKAKKMRILAGSKRARDEEEEYMKGKGGLRQGEQRATFAGSTQRQQDSSINTEEKPAFQGIGSQIKKSVSPPVNIGSKPARPFIPLSR